MEVQYPLHCLWLHSTLNNRSSPSLSPLPFRKTELTTWSQGTVTRESSHWESTEGDPNSNRGSQWSITETLRCTICRRDSSEIDVHLIPILWMECLTTFLLYLIVSVSRFVWQNRILSASHFPLKTPVTLSRPGVPSLKLSLIVHGRFSVVVKARSAL